MKLYIKNMVCSRCKMVVKDELIKLGIRPASVELGEVEVAGQLDPQQKVKLNNALHSFGFELLDDKKARLIEKIKNTIVELVHYSDHQLKTNLSHYISNKLHRDYNYLSNIFSEIEGTTIEKYFISQKIEKAKELLKYNEFSLSEIAVQLGYTHVSYLSSQFKKETGITPTGYKALLQNTRTNLEDL